MQLKFAVDIYVSMTSLWNREQYVQGASLSLVMQFVFGIVMSTHMELLCLHSCYNIAALHSWEIPWFIALPFWFFPYLLTLNTPVQKAVEYFVWFSLISSQLWKWALFLKDYRSSDKKHWRPLRGSGATCIPLGTGAQLKLRRELRTNSWNGEAQ